MLFLPPIELCDYVEISNDTVKLIKELPDELVPVYEDFKTQFEQTAAKKPKIIT